MTMSMFGRSSRYNIGMERGTLDRAMEAASRNARAVPGYVQAAAGQQGLSYAGSPAADRQQEELAAKMAEFNKRVAQYTGPQSHIRTPEEQIAANQELSRIHSQPVPERRIGRFGPGGTPMVTPSIAVAPPAQRVGVLSAGTAAAQPRMVPPLVIGGEPSPPPPLIRALESPFIKAPAGQGAGPAFVKAPVAPGQAAGSPFVNAQRIGAPQPGRPQKSFSGPALPKLEGEALQRVRAKRAAGREATARQRVEARAFRQGMDLGSIPFQGPQGGYQRGDRIQVQGAQPIGDINRRQDAEALSMKEQNARIAQHESETALNKLQADPEFLRTHGALALAQHGIVGPAAEEFLRKFLPKVPARGAGGVPFPPQPGFAAATPQAVGAKGGPPGANAVQAPSITGPQADTILENHPDILKLFDRNAKGDPMPLKELAATLDTKNVTGYNDPNSPLGQAILSKVRDTYGAGLEQQLVKSPPLYGTMNLSPAIPMLMGFNPLGQGPEAYYKKQLAGTNLYNRLAGLPEVPLYNPDQPPSSPSHPLSTIGPLAGLNAMGEGLQSASMPDAMRRLIAPTPPGPPSAPPGPPLSTMGPLGGMNAAASFIKRLAMRGIQP